MAAVGGDRLEIIAASTGEANEKPEIGNTPAGGTWRHLGRRVYLWRCGYGVRVTGGFGEGAVEGSLV